MNSIDQTSQKVIECYEISQKLSRRLAQHTDLRLENIWGEFCASIEWTKNKISQSNETKNYLETICNEFLEILKDPAAKETPTAIMAGELFCQFLKPYTQLQNESHG
jgi:hypothetical protein